jgi:hypothetical protein
MIPDFSERLMEGTEEDCMAMADLVRLFFSPQVACTSSDILQIQKGVSSARSDDTKSIKGAVLDWITPRDTPLNPPLSRNVKANRGFHHYTTGALLCPAGIDWKDPE